MSLIRNVGRLAQQSARQVSTSSVCNSAKGEVHPGYQRLKEVQAKFQKPDGLPVHLKMGARDQIMYRITMGLSLVGLGFIGKLFYELSYPKEE
ncbi:cytochrome c oxidase subunit 7A, mitochondrial [Phlebotomus argentipes]|uniref:cytochrome c oxidase subunit 7A, mitochondrial n=1 Tax=Phlebotomus argentipes TaxID=94469 RepID=UPI00289320EF|nr:cytochrome c oxidase subunit 7A, mitochondrial [Phlebotomus argentipes]